MNEYQKFVADKARVLVDLMEQKALKDDGVARLLGAMRSDLTAILSGKERLPSRSLKGWGLYFSPEGPHGIYDAYPELVDAKAALAWPLDYADMESYLQAREKLSRQ
jgi:hypothetical protein